MKWIARFERLARPQALHCSSFACGRAVLVAADVCSIDAQLLGWCCVSGIFVEPYPHVKPMSLQIQCCCVLARSAQLGTGRRCKGLLAGAAVISLYCCHTVPCHQSAAVMHWVAISAPSDSGTHPLAASAYLCWLSLSAKLPMHDITQLSVDVQPAGSSPKVLCACTCWKVHCCCVVHW